MSSLGLDVNIGTDEDASAWGSTQKSANHVADGHTEDFLRLIESGVSLVVSNSGRNESLQNSNESNL